MKFLRHSLAGIFLASLTLALLIYAAQLVTGALQERMSADNRPPPARERVFAVNVVTAKLGTVTPYLTAFGEVESRRTLELRSAAGGQVISLAESFVEGGAVQAGELLMEIDPADAQAALERAQSDLLDAEAEVRDAARALDLARDEVEAARDQAELRDRTFQRQKDLAERGVGTAAAAEQAELAAAQARQSLLSRRLAEAQAEARVDQAATRKVRAEIALRSAERDLADTRLTAAFDGTLSEVTVVEGRLVSPNEKLAKLIDPSALEVVFRISTAQYARLLDGQGRLLQAPVRATLDMAGVDLTATGRISRDSAATGEGQSGRLIFGLLDSAPGFKPGDFVTVSVEEPPLDRVAKVPASALDASGAVLVLGPEDRLQALPVQLVRRQGDNVLIRGAGLDGREVVIGRTPLLGEGIKVRPLRQDENSGVQVPQEAAMITLSEERRAKIVAFVTANKRMPDEVKARILSAMENEQVPERMVQRIESRMGG